VVEVDIIKLFDVVVLGVAGFEVLLLEIVKESKETKSLNKSLLFPFDVDEEVLLVVEEPNVVVFVCIGFIIGVELVCMGCIEIELNKLLLLFIVVELLLVLLKVLLVVVVVEEAGAGLDINNENKSSFALFVLVFVVTPVVVVVLALVTGAL